MQQKKVAGALRAASSQADISGGRAGFRGIVLWEKAPASLPTLSQARTLPWRGETSLRHELLSRHGSLRGFALHTCFYTQQRPGPGCLPRHCRAPRTFPGCCFSAGPVCGRARLLRAGAGQSPVGASLRKHGERSLCRPPRAQPAFPASRNSFPVPTTAGTPVQRGTIHSRPRNRRHWLEGSRNCPVCCRPGRSAFFPRREGSCPVPGGSSPSSIPRGPPRALRGCGPGSGMGGGK